MDALIGWPGGDWQSTARLAATIVVGYLVLLWLASVLWAYRDIRSRTADPVSQAIGVALVTVFPFAGIGLYTLVRPAETLNEAYERQLEQEALRSELFASKMCPHCRRPAQEDFIVCAYCRSTLRDECTACGRLLQLEWAHCPYCAAPHGVAPVERARGAMRYSDEQAHPVAGRNRSDRGRQRDEMADAPTVMRPQRPQPQLRPEE